MAAPAAGASLGIVAGGGAVPILIATRARQAGRRPVCFGIVGEADARIAEFDHHWVRWGELGRLFSGLKAEGIVEIVIVGSVNRPDPSTVRLDLGAFTRLPQILAAMLGGDDSVLVRVVRLFESQGFTVRGAHELVPDLVAGEGALTRRRPNRAAVADIAAGLEAVALLGRLDIGQAAVAAGGRVVAVEGIEGTDGILARMRDLRTVGRLKAAPGSGVLVKAAKPAQDLRVDMPTIGPATVAGAAEAGLAGIALEAGRVMIVDRPDVIAAADAAGLFVVGVSAGAGPPGR